MSDGQTSAGPVTDASMGALAAVPRIRTGGDVAVRAASVSDAERLTEIYNFYITNTAITFDIEPQTVAQRSAWMAQYGETGRHRLMLAVKDDIVMGYAASSRFHPRAAYDTTVETTIVCAPEAVGLGLGRLLYRSLFDALQGEDIHLLVALVTMPNAGSAALHERMGYRQKMLLQEAGRKFDRWWDVAWYVRPGWA